MRPILIILCFLTGLHAGAQQYKDTTFTERGFTCTCKYNFNSEDDNKLFDRSEIPARYPGGDAEWKKFVKMNIDRSYKGKHPVEIRFQVDKNGDLSTFMLQNKAPNQKYEEVVRLLRSSGKWFPSVQNGFCAKSYVRLSFEL
jgi:hypothetical protein